MQRPSSRLLRTDIQAANDALGHDDLSHYLITVALRMPYAILLLQCLLRRGATLSVLDPLDVSCDSLSLDGAVMGASQRREQREQGLEKRLKNDRCFHLKCPVTREEE